MHFASPLVRARLVQRYKRFLADVILDDGSALTVACPNTGAMLGLTEPGSIVWLSQSDNPKRKYRHTWEMIEAGDATIPTLVGINPTHPNRIVAEAIAAGRIETLARDATLRREVKYGTNSRVDILLEDVGRGLTYVEVKNVHLSRAPGLAEFPDSVTQRGTKHFGELAAMVAAGHRAVLVYLVQRCDVSRFALARDIDPAYAAAFDHAAAAGVEMLAYRSTLTTAEVVIDQAMPIVGHTPM